MNEWKELQINNLPPDILTGKYEFCLKDIANIGCLSNGAIFDLLKAIINGDEYQYRKPEPKQPTHEEIMTKWWKDRKDFWRSVIGFYKGSYHLSSDSLILMVQKEWFKGLESADIPPEA